MSSERICAFNPGDDPNRNVYGSKASNDKAFILWTTYDMESEDSLSEAISKMIREADFTDQHIEDNTMEGIEICVRFDRAESFAETFKDFPWGQDVYKADTFEHTGVLMRMFEIDGDIHDRKSWTPVVVNAGNWAKIVFKVVQ